jgi:aquaporin Z
VPDRDLVKSLIVEFIGPFALVFAGVGAIIQTSMVPGMFELGGDLVAVAFAHGLAIGLIITAAGHISGGHFNPAVTIGFLLTRRITTDRAIAYVVAQIAGALAGALALVLVYRDIDRNRVNLGVPAIGQNHEWYNALVMEVILTFFLMFVIFGVAVDSRATRYIPGLAIGLTITMDILGGGAVSGAAMNPARYLGPALVQLGDANWEDCWIWIVGPIAGAAVAAFLYNDVLLGVVRPTVPTAPRGRATVPARAPEPREVIGDQDDETLATPPAPAAPAAPSSRSQRRRGRR